MTGPFPLVELTRGSYTESLHDGWVAALDASGRLAVDVGADTVVLPRSTLKPLQVLACLRLGVQVADEELALGCSSHDGTDEHVAVVRRILAAYGLNEADLGCTPLYPTHDLTRARLLVAGEPPAAIRADCSGKHAVLLAACVAQGWPLDGYLDPSHPLQLALRAVIGELAQEVPGEPTVDGCGAPVMGVTLRGLARAFRTLAMAPAGHEHAIAEAFRRYPWYVGGRPHDDTDLMDVVPGAMAKLGAEGLFVMALATGETVALKIADGSGRARKLVALAALRVAGGNIGDSLANLDVAVLGHGEQVGSARMAPQWAHLPSD